MIASGIDADMAIFVVLLPEELAVLRAFVISGSVFVIVTAAEWDGREFDDSVDGVEGEGESGEDGEFVVVVGV